MSLAAPSVGAADLVDDIGQRRPASRETAFSGAIFDIVRDVVDLGGSGTVTREYMAHPGAVIVLPLREDRGRPEVLLVRQYRHALGVTEWELPAGLLDVGGEAPVDAAARELAEEVDLRAARWDLLSGYSPSPGATAETVRIFLARDLVDVPEDRRHRREAEEADMTSAWIALDDAADAVLAGTVTNTGLVVGVLAAQASRARGWSTLRAVDEPWPLHPSQR